MNKEEEQKEGERFASTLFRRVGGKSGPRSRPTRSSMALLLTGTTLARHTSATTGTREGEREKARAEDANRVTRP